MARISVSGNAQVVANGVANVGGGVRGGLQVVFGGVEVFEIRAKDLGWRKTLVAAGLFMATIACAGVWVNASRGEITPEQFRQCAIVTGIATLYAMWALRQFGVVWRFDHKRKTITRKHWLRGLSRNWKSGQVAGVAVLDGKRRTGLQTVQLALVDAEGRPVAEVGAWETAKLDLPQVQAVVAEIKKVMWWR